MSDESENAIRTAVRNCLARCYGGSAPLGVLAECLAELRTAGWSEENVRLVETAARKVLAGMMPDEDSDLSEE